MGLYGVISNLLSLGAQLLPALSASAQAPSSSSFLSSPVKSQQIEIELQQLMRMLERIKATLYDAEMREIRDLSVKLWLKELQGVAYDAEDVLDEYRYEVLRAQVEARDSSHLNSRKRKLIQVPDGMLDRFRQIMSKFSEIEKHRIALRLTEEDGPRRCNSDQKIPPTSHLVVESDIIGRESEKNNLIDVLSSANHDGKIVSVVTIVGTGGIGKTTLAKLVYNDQKIQQKFDKFGWVCVSEDFNVQRLTREVVESITRISCAFANLSALQEHMKEEISDKTVFLVLDDVWNENRSFWESFKVPFMSASLVKILVTTRNESVARIMQTVPTFNVSYMTEEQSWQLFQHCAFGEFIQNMGLTFVEIGKQIMKKCGMLPLAIKSIASLLRHEPKENIWREILESDLWETGASNEIFQPLQISYARLPTYLKPCFLYCSMFPRDYEYGAEELVKLWISQGYVQTNGLKNAKKIGLEYVKQLWQRSFFQGKYAWNKCMENFVFTLHDMVHDLARFNSGHACYSIEGGMDPKFPEELYHLFVNRWEKSEYITPPGKFSALRSCVVEGNGVTFLSAFDFSRARYLRTLRLSFGQWGNYSEFHFSFANLKHLRYLSISCGFFKRLPECMCSLFNLQIFTLKRCPYLKELPKCIGNLVSLEELTISGRDDLELVPSKNFRIFDLWSTSLKKLPTDMGNLVSLEKLMISYCRNLKVLPLSLCQLKVMQELEITECSKLEELPPDMGNLVSLKKLIISGCHNLRVLPVSLCQLKILQELEITRCSELEELPPDMGNLVSLKKLIISGCDNLRVLPISLCQLKVMQELEITECSELEELPPDMGNLVSLEKLMISYCRNLKVLPASLCQLKVMQELKITKCSELEELPHDMGNLLSLKKLIISDYYNLKVLPVSLCQLKVLLELEIDGCYELEELPPDIGNLVSLKKLIISCCDNLRVLPVSLRQLKVLQQLKIIECSKLEELPIDIGNLVSLEKLMIYYCHNLKVLPVSLCQLKVMRELEITGCSELEEVPRDMGNLVSLKKLIISGCDNLRVLPVSLCQLKVLQELKIIKCSKLKGLPPDMGNLANLQLLNIFSSNINSLPRSLNKLIRMPILKVMLHCRRISWLEDFVDLEGTLRLTRLCHVGNLEDVHCANLASMHNLQLLILNWGSIHEEVDDLASWAKVVWLNIDSDGAASSEIDHRALMGRLQPHPNLKELEIYNYGGLTFPDWFGNPTLLVSFERIKLECCTSITFLPFGSFDKLKYLKIRECSSLQFIQEQSLPLVLEQIEIFHCQSLISVTGIERLKFLVKLNIAHCSNLHWLESSGKAGIITVSRCPKVRELSLQHGINYLISEQERT